jgi:hypothetical protein
LQKQPLGEYIVDVQATLGADGSIGEPKFVQKKLEKAVERCILEARPKVKVPGPDGKQRLLRCTNTGQRMAGGAGMHSVDYRVE